MGQEDIIKFLEKEFHKNPERTFTKEEIGIGTGKGIKYYSLNSLVDHGEIIREYEIVITNKCGYRQFRYRYLPNGPFLITNFRK